MQFCSPTSCFDSISRSNSLCSLYARTHTQSMHARVCVVNERCRIGSYHASPAQCSLPCFYLLLSWSFCIEGQAVQQTENCLTYFWQNIFRHSNPLTNKIRRGYLHITSTRKGIKISTIMSEGTPTFRRRSCCEPATGRQDYSASGGKQVKGYLDYIVLLVFSLIAKINRFSILFLVFRFFLGIGRIQ